jgi:hypothetical protein
MGQASSWEMPGSRLSESRVPRKDFAHVSRPRILHRGPGRCWLAAGPYQQYELPFQRKGVLSREISVWQDLEGCILAYAEAAGIVGNGKEKPLFRARIIGMARRLTGNTNMNYLRSEFDLEADDVVVVDLDGQANVLLMDRSNFDACQDRRSYRYYGGLAEKTPVRLVVPRTGHWHLVVDLGGYAGTVKAGVRIEKSGQRAAV